MPGEDTRTSIIVPAYREAPNLPVLIDRVFAACAQEGIDAELIVVDDGSDDGTEELIQSLQGRYPVRLVVRRGERGLSSAVLRGFAESRYDTFVVLDADLQHPPELIPQLVQRLHRGDCDFVIASRYAGGRIAQSWPWFRRLGSTAATALARPLASVSDPMSGFFALGRQTWQSAAPLDPIGYKIALELLVKGRCRRPVEVPIEFAARQAGQSKAGFREMAHYLRHLWRLYRFAYPLLSALLPAAVVLSVYLVARLLWPSHQP